MLGVVQILIFIGFVLEEDMCEKGYFDNKDDTYFLMIVSGMEYLRRRSPGEAEGRAGTSPLHMLARTLACSHVSQESSLTAFLELK